MLSRPIAGYVFGDSTCGQRACSTKSASLASRCSTSTTTARPDRARSMLARNQAISRAAWPSAFSSLGFEQMEKGALGAKYGPTELNPLDQTRGQPDESSCRSFTQAPPAPAQMFGGAGREYQWKHGTKRRDVRQDQRVKARQARGQESAYALFREELLGLEEILASPEVNSIRSRAFSAARQPAAPQRPFVCIGRLRQKAQPLEPGLHRWPMAMATDKPARASKRNR